MPDRPYGLGWVPSLPDIRDIPFKAETKRRELPAKVDLRGSMPPIGNQGRIGSCTAWASLAAYRYLLLKEGKSDADFSELAQYWWSRELEGTTRSDAGATIRDAVKVMAKRGLAPEREWPYSEQGVFRTPPQRVKDLAKLHQAIQYEAVRHDEYAMKAALADGFPIVMGISVYSSLYSDDALHSGLVPMPQPGDRLEGGHAILICGYGHGPNGTRWPWRNSWGEDFGEGGYGWLETDYITNKKLASDLWIVRSCEG